MGINNLWPYVFNAENDLITRRRLTEMPKLIIDGNNLSYNLFYNAPEKLKQANLCGGDYAHYGQYVSEWFQKLASFGVQPIVLFDGVTKNAAQSQENEEKLISKLENKLEEIIRVCMQIPPKKGTHANRRICGWPSASTVAFQVLRDLGISHRQCIGAADEVIAVLARYYNCPVLTNDADFLLYDLPGGVIKMEKFFETINEQTEPAQEYQVVNTGKLYRRFHETIIEKQLDRLIGPLLGYDHVDQYIAKRFVSQIQLQLLQQVDSFQDKIKLSLKKFSDQFAKTELHKAANNFQKNILNIFANRDNFVSVTKVELDEVTDGFNQQIETLKNECSSMGPREFGIKLKAAGQSFENDIAIFAKFFVSKTRQNNNQFNDWFYDRMKIVSRWLSEQDSQQSAIEQIKEICETIKQLNERNKGKNATNNPGFVKKMIFQPEQIEKFVQHFEELPVPLYVKLASTLAKLEPNLTSEQFFDQMKQELFPLEAETEKIPLELYNGLVSAELNPSLLKILYNRLDVCPLVLEDHRMLDSSYVCTNDLYPIIYGMILSIGAGGGSSKGNSTKVRRIFAENGEIKTVDVFAKQKLDNKKLAMLETILKKTEQDRVELFFQIVQKACFTKKVDIDELNSQINALIPKKRRTLRQPLLLMLLSLIMCHQKCPSRRIAQNSRKWSAFIKAMFVNIAFLGHIGPGESQNNIPPFVNFEPAERNTVQHRMNQFDQTPDEMDIQITHYFNCFHNCLQSLNSLAQLMNLHKLFQVDRFICGLQATFVHNLTKHLNDEKPNHFTLNILDDTNHLNGKSYVNLKLIKDKLYPEVFENIAQDSTISQTSVKKSREQEDHETDDDTSHKRVNKKQKPIVEDENRYEGLRSNSDDSEPSSDHSNDM